MPGLERGLLPLAQLSLALRQHETARIAVIAPETDWGPYRSWVEPTLLVARGELDGAREALRTLASPPRDLLFEALWAMVASAATAVGDRETMRRARTQLAPAAAETTAQSGLLNVGPVRTYLDEIDAALRRSSVG